MDIEKFRKYCLSLPMTSEDMPFGDDYLIFRVCGKIFACIGLARSDYFVLKCQPDYALELRERYPEIEPAWHWNKKYWNQLRLGGSMRTEFIEGLIRHSYAQVVAKLPKRIKTEFPELLTIE